MNRLIWIACTALIFSAVSAFSHDGPECAYYHRYESYGLGLIQGYLGGFDPALAVEDQRCFRLGLADGAEVRQQFGNDSWCKSAWDDAIAQAMRADIHSIGSPSECSNIGYVAGITLRSGYARLGRSDIVGSVCVEAYEQGQRDAAAGTMGSHSSNLQYACYRTGYDDYGLGL